MDRSKDAENILQRLGSRGRWQTAIFILHAGIFGSLALEYSAGVYFGKMKFLNVQNS